MSSTTHTHHVCDRCRIEVVLPPHRRVPPAWMEVRGEMWDQDDDSTGVQFYALLCASCRSDLDDFKERAPVEPGPS